MRAFFSIVETLLDSVRFIIGMIVLVIMGLGLMLTFGASYVAPKAVDSLGERVERAGEKRIRAKQQERVAEEMAEDGWGYGAATASVGDGTSSGFADNR